MAELRARLREAEDTLDAIRNGEVDAVVVGGPAGQQVYTLENADRPYRVLIEQMNEGAITLGEDGTVLYCNQRFASLVETPREEIIGGIVGRFLGADERQDLQGLLGRGPGVGASREFTFFAAGSKKVPVNVSLIDLKVADGMPRLVCGVVTDLTQNRRRSQELAAANANLANEIEDRRRAEDSLQIALDAAGMGSWDIDLATNFLQRSLRHDQIYGHARVLPAWNLRTLLEQFIPEERAAIEAAFMEAAASGVIELERRICRAGDGAFRWVHVKGRTYYQDGKPTRMAGVVSDVTDRRRLEEQLRQAQKMEVIGHLTGGVAHDFNNLLTIIVGNLETLQRQLKSQPSNAAVLERPVDNAMRGAQRAVSLTQRLLAFSRQQPLDPKPVNISRLVSGMSDLLRRSLGEQIAVETVMPGGMWRANVDANQLEIAILNLAVNARDAMPNGGKLTIETSNVLLDERYAGDQAEVMPGQYVMLAVTDNGTGMSRETIAKAFEPFFTTKDVGHGTGLGLSQVYGFVKQSGGHVKIYSELGEGTSVKIYLPRLYADEASEAEESVVKVPRGESNETILVTEDDEDVRAYTQSILRELGYEVLEAPNGTAALELLARHPEIRLLFTDVGLPGGMNGRQLAEAARQQHPRLKVLFTTGYARNAIMHDGRVDPGVELITKPFTYAALAGKLRDILDVSTGPSRVLLVEDEILIQMLAIESLEELGFKVEIGWFCRRRQKQAAPVERRRRRRHSRYRASGCERRRALERNPRHLSCVARAGRQRTR